VQYKEGFEAEKWTASSTGLTNFASYHQPSMLGPVACYGLVPPFQGLILVLLVGNGEQRIRFLSRGFKEHFLQLCV
jgi:hypothetical protein